MPTGHPSPHLFFRCRARVGGVWLGLLLLAGCQSGGWTGFPPPPAEGPVWPSAPGPERVRYVQSIHDCGDLFTEGGGWNTLVRWITGPSDSAMVRPYALALHPLGGLLVADPGRARVHFYCWAQRRYIALGAEREGGLPSPVGVGVMPDGRILVSDSRLGQLLLYDVAGEALGPFAAEVDFQRPAGVAIDPQGRVFVADVLRHQVAVLNPDGTLARWIGQRGAGDGEFNFPTHLALAPDGGLVVSDAMNFRVQLLDAEGRFRMTAGQAGDAPGMFSKPKGVAMSRGGTLVAVEGLYDTVQFFSPAGKLLLSVGESGQGPGQFWLPAGLCLDAQAGRLFVADSYNHRVQVFNLTEDVTP